MPDPPSATVARYADLYQDIHQMHAYVDPASGVIIECNDTLVGKTGIPRAELVGRPILELYDEECRELARAAHRRLELADRVEDVALLLNRPSAESLHVELRAAWVTDVGGTVWRMSWSDISQLRAVEAELLQSQKLELVGSLVCGLAHDYNNTLSVVLGYSELLIGSLNKNEAGWELATEVVKAAAWATALTGQLLSFSRRSTFQMKPLDVNQMVVQTKRMVDRLIGEDIEVALQLDSQNPLVIADSALIPQVVMNLVINARDAMPDGGRITIQTRLGSDKALGASDDVTLPPGKHVALDVRDNGIGIPANDLQRIFEPFYTTKERGKGTGLGLSTIRRIVDRFQGQVRVKSTVKRGTQFTIYLPQHLPRELVGEAEDEAFESAAGGDELILVVEDDDILRVLMTRLLRDTGYTVLEAPNGDEALRGHQDQFDKIDLLITDVVMPGISGTELAIRMMERAGDGPRVLFMSGYPEFRSSDHRFLKHHPDFLPKPLNRRMLLEKVRSVLDAEISKSAQVDV